jgi:two-component system, cell cycle sensor histidine kinase and response regulator CckA
MVEGGDPDTELDALSSTVRALADSEARLRATLDNSSDFIFFVEQSGEWDANQTATRRMGYEPSYHPDDPLLFVHPDDRSMAADALAEIFAGQRGENEPVELRLLHADGAILTYEFLGRRVDEAATDLAVVVTARDVTELRAARAAILEHERERDELEIAAKQARLDARLQQAQRLESLSRLGAGVAHDFNNLIGVVQNHMLVVERHGVLDHHGMESLAAAREALALAGDLVHRLLQVGEVSDLTAERFDVAAATRDLHALLDRATPADVELVLTISDDPLEVRATRGEWEQIVLNLVLNAAEAITGPGTIRVSLFAAEGHARLDVVDTGRGMPHHVRERAFDPFFTTKATANASGLGLSTVYAFVQRAGGTIAIDSEPGDGTTVTIAWPIAESPGLPARAKVRN